LYPDVNQFLNQIDEIVHSNQDRDTKFESICELLAVSVSHYDWVGIYIADNEKKQLNLVPYVGKNTSYVKIPFGEGVCGQVAEKQVMIVVQDVSKKENYLSCGLEVKSEIAVPIIEDNVFVGEIDIDSFVLAPFTDKDEELLTEVAEHVSKLF